MVLGIYYLTQERTRDRSDCNRKALKDMNEAMIAYENHEITLHAKVKIRRYGINAEGKMDSRVIESTLGRFIFNEIIAFRILDL